MQRTILAIGAVLVGIAISQVEIYMDELFHVPQYRRVFGFVWEGKAWEWDPAITTFPGLYFLSSLWPFELSTVGLRAVNAVVLNIAMYLASQSIENKSSLSGLMVVMFPLNFFYSCMYYTDCAATVFVLLTFALMRKQMFVVSGVVSAIAVLMRQTNVVFVFGFCLSETISRWMKSQDLRGCIWSVLTDMWIHIMVGVSFVIFVVKFNKGAIVLGHHEFHSLSIHLAQLNYLVLTAVGALGPVSWIETLRDLRKCWRRQLWRLIAVFILSAGAAELGTIAHPFIISDNRHYAFYFFKYFVSRRWIRSLLIPAIVALSICHSPIFTKSNIGLPKWIFWMCASICVVPTPLLEFRYFNIPISLLLTGIEGRPTTVWFFTLVNVVVLYVFVYRPFQTSDGEIARFMY
jgi:alpha-1,2-glucosyltransferase